jgi:hypothetical protein
MPCLTAIVLVTALERATMFRPLALVHISVIANVRKLLMLLKEDRHETDLPE